MMTHSFRSAPTEVSKSWGQEKIFYNSDNYCSKALIIAPGSETSMHFHKYKHETMTVVSGEAIIETINNKEKIVYYLHDLESVVIPENTPHKIINASNSNKLVIMEASTRDQAEDSYRI